MRGLPLLMYPLAAVEAAVARAAADFPSDRPDSAGHFLALALYSLEREDEFSGDLIIVSTDVHSYSGHSYSDIMAIVTKS